MNYKNKNKYKRNKNKIIKIIGFDNNNLWLDIYQNFQKNNSINYESIIFYDIKFKLSEELELYIAKQPIIPIILTDNAHSICIINSNDILHLVNNNQIKCISNLVINYEYIKNTYFSNANINEFHIMIHKLYDTYNY